MSRWRFQQYVEPNDSQHCNIADNECQREESHLQRQRNHKRKLKEKGESSSTGANHSSTLNKCNDRDIPDKAFELPAPTICNRCEAKKFAYESRGFCCADGQLSQDVVKENRKKKSHVENTTAIYYKYEKRLINQADLDEISCYQSARWISPPKLHGESYGFIMYDMHPAVLQLQIFDPKLSLWFPR